jgi:hypothetical protein
MFFHKNHIIRRIYLIFILLLVGSCDKKEIQNERVFFVNKLNAFNLLNDNHELLHVMLGEKKGDGKIAFEKFKTIIQLSNNNELLPIINATNNIIEYSKSNKKIENLDYLVDYYQAGLSMQVESILKGYGVARIVPNDSILDVYDKLLKNH